jgi:hypothetical protein
MTSTKAKTTVPQHGRLLAELTCPNCWHRFKPEEVLFISRHDELVGDPIVGEQAYQRFRPSRFNIAGDALDARGMTCQQLACPRCHLEIARPLIEMAPFFVSIVGAPSAGKSYFLATMAWQMRQMASRFGFSFADGDPTANQELQKYEQLLFTNTDPDTPIAIRKTDPHDGALHQTATLDGQTMTFPRPFQFTISPQPKYFDTSDRDCPFRSLVLYDNAGEHFQPGADTPGSPVTLHLAESRVAMFVFDPLQDARFRAHCSSAEPQAAAGASVSRQEVIFNEMAARIRRYRGLGQAEKHDRPLVVILAKADAWLDPAVYNEEPLLEGDPAGLSLATINRVSDHCRDLLAQHCPEMLDAVEGFARRVVFIPVSALGTSPEKVTQAETSFLGVRPRHIDPHWAYVPLLWALAMGVPGLVRTDRNRARS